MGVAASFVLVASNLLISLLRKVIPASVRIPIFIVIIAAFVTLIDLLMHAYQPELYKNLGVFVPLIVVNCIILGRAEAFAYRNGLLRSILDGLGMGLGFTLVIVILGAFREILGNGTLTLFNTELFNLGTGLLAGADLHHAARGLPRDRLPDGAETEVLEERLGHDHE